MVYDPVKIKYTAEYLRGISPEELQDLLKEAERYHYALRCQASQYGLKKVTEQPHLFRRVGRDIAQIKTILNEERILK